MGINFSAMHILKFISLKNRITARKSEFAEIEKFAGM